MMSGGSYNYLCYASADELINKTADLQDIADRLAGLGYAKDAALETQSLLLIIRQYENRIEAMKNRLDGVWKAIEWWDSADTNEDSFKEALEKYRGQ